MEAKPKQIPSDLNQTPLEENPSVAPASLVESGSPTNNLLPESYKVGLLDPPTVRLMGPQQTMRKAPDIADLARRGGLPASVQTYELGYRDKDGTLHLTCPGESTATVNRAVALGLERAIETARDYLVQYPDASASETREAIKHLDLGGPEWLKKNLPRADRSNKELAEDIYNARIAVIPTVGKWGMAPTLEPGRGKLSTAELAKYIEKHRVRFCGEWQGWDKLTVFQLQAASLRWECKCSVSKIAELLGVTRKSVDDRLHGADQKITAASGASRNDKKKAKRGSDY
jgi:hypothetical protein